MKGLLLKDWYMVTRYCWVFFLLDVVFIAAALFALDAPIFLAYPCAFSALLPITLYSYDDKEKWNVYGAALPVSRAQHVSVKYVIGLISLAAVFLVSALAQAVAGAVMPERGTGYLPMLLIASAMGLLLPAVVMPLMFRFGVEKARIFYFIAVGVVCAAFIALMDFDSALTGPPDIPIDPGVLCLIALALYAASWALSVALYKKREL